MKLQNTPAEPGLLLVLILWQLNPNKNKGDSFKETDTVTIKYNRPHVKLTGIHCGMSGISWDKSVIVPNLV